MRQHWPRDAKATTLANRRSSNYSGQAKVAAALAEGREGHVPAMKGTPLPEESPKDGDRTTQEHRARRNPEENQSHRTDGVRPPNEPLRILRNRPAPPRKGPDQPGVDRSIYR